MTAFCFDPCREWLLVSGPVLLLATGIDRIVAMSKPMYYKAQFPRKRFLIAMLVVSILLGIPAYAEFTYPYFILEMTVKVPSSGKNVTLYSRDSHVNKNSSGFYALTTFNAAIRMSTLVLLAIVCAAVADV